MIIFQDYRIIREEREMRDEERGGREGRQACYMQSAKVQCLFVSGAGPPPRG